MFTQSDIVTAHSFCRNHRAAFAQDRACGCFFCCSVFSPTEITAWLNEEDGTALCPYCGVDAVLGESAGYPLTKEFLRAMRQYWFETPVNANIGEHK